jgi:hypothetical protein
LKNFFLVIADTIMDAIREKVACQMQYPMEKLCDIAAECAEFEHVIAAMGYGCSLLNVSPDRFIRKCDDCVNWQAGSCGIFQKELSVSQLEDQASVAQQ